MHPHSLLLLFKVYDMSHIIPVKSKKDAEALRHFLFANNDTV